MSLDPTRRVGRVRLSNVSVEPDAWLHDVLPVARSVALLLAAADAAGGAQECVAMATAYAKDREQFGRPIGMFQAVKHHCANMLVAAELATAAVWDAARAGDGTAEQFELACAAAAAHALPAFYPQRTAQHPDPRRCRVHLGTRRPAVPPPCRHARRAARCRRRGSHRHPLFARRCQATPRLRAAARSRGVPRRGASDCGRARRTRFRRAARAARSTRAMCNRTGRSRGDARPRRSSSW